MRMARGLSQALLAANLAIACGDNQLAEVPPVGSVEGFICDPIADAVAVGARVRGQGPNGRVEARTNVVGYFRLDGLDIGRQVLEVNGGTFTDAVAVEVRVGGLTRLPDPACLDTAPGSLHGKVCGVGNGIAGSNYWVDEARVYIVEGQAVYETFTNSRGEYDLLDVPPGPQTLHVEKGSYNATLEVMVQSGGATDVDPVCVGNSVKVGVVTGLYDAMHQLLLDLNLRVRNCIPSTADFCPAQLSQNGAITLIDGIDSSDYITEVLMDPLALGEFDILFFNCGMADIYLGSSPPQVFDNLQDFVADGGSIYVSDWAYEILRLGFASSFDFHGDDNVRGAAKIGLIDDALLADIVDTDLIGAIGSNRVQLTFPKGSWVVPSAVQSTAVEVWVRGDILANPSGTGTTLYDTPLLMHTTVGDGNVFFTTFHASEEFGVGDQMLAILQYLVFEL